MNAPTQFVIAGSDSGMVGVLERAKDEGARIAKRLPVSVPSHCALLKSVADELTRRIAQIEIKTSKAIYVSNRGARPLRILMEFERIWQPILPTRFVGTTRQHWLTSEAAVFS